jgi:hypothetical protein
MVKKHLIISIFAIVAISGTCSWGRVRSNHATVSIGRRGLRPTGFSIDAAASKIFEGSQMHLPLDAARLTIQSLFNPVSD